MASWGIEWLCHVAASEATRPRDDAKSKRRSRGNIGSGLRNAAVTARKRTDMAVFAQPHRSPEDNTAATNC
jgi:hypothetical protein